MTTIEIAAQTGAVVTVEPGQRLDIVDVEGAQVADMFAVAADDHSEWLSTSATRTANGRLFPLVGESFLTGSYRPLLTFEADGSPGVHDMLAAPCSPPMYASATTAVAARTSGCPPSESAGGRPPCPTR